MKQDVYYQGRHIAIRSLQLKDAGLLGTLIYTDKRLHKYGVGGSLKKIVPGKEFLDETIQWCNQNNSISMAILDSDNLAIGLISLSHINQEEKSAGIGYWLGSSYWGKGYGSEAFALTLKLALEMKLMNIRATIQKTNEASKRIWQKFGGQMQPKDEKKLHYTITLTPESCTFTALQNYFENQNS